MVLNFWFFKKVTTLEEGFLPHQGLFVFSHPKCKFLLFVEKPPQKSRPWLPELLIPIGYICSSKKVKAQQSQTIHKITASPIFISTQLLLILLHLPYFSKKNIDFFTLFETSTESLILQHEIEMRLFSWFWYRVFYCSGSIRKSSFNTFHIFP